MAREYDVELALLPRKNADEASFGVSEGQDHLELHELKHRETEMTVAAEDFVSVPTVQFERLLTSIKETLDALRNSHASSIDHNSSSTSTLLPEPIRAPQILTPKSTNQPQQKSPSKQALPPIEHYDNHRTEQDIARQENNWNNEKREWWPVLDDLFDVWEYYFPDCQHIETDPEHSNCHPLTNPRFRMSIQRDLVLARLCLERNPARNTFRFLPWLSLIGYKLSQLSGLMRTYAHTSAGDSRRTKDVLVQQCKMLVQIVRYFFEGPSEYLPRHAGSIPTTLGSMLGFCVRRNLLPRPIDGSDPVVKDAALFFAYSSSEFNQRVPILKFESHSLPPLLALSKSIGQLEALTWEKEPEPVQAEGDNLLCKDLNIQSLRKIGGLKLVWTACDKDHLYLDQENGVLRLGWYNMVFDPEFHQYMPMMGNNDIVRTWELLLSHRHSQYDFEELETIPFPPEFAGYRACLWKGRLASQRSLKSMFTRRLNQIPDLHDKFVPMAELPRSLPYTSFGSYEKRLRVLRHYMDTSKPTGFRNLWHDRRDSLTYYTFWGVIVLGGLSVLLGLLSLLVGVAQTIAAFKALED